MINLIPNTEKKGKVSDFYFRLTTLALFIFGCAFLVSTMAILPAYLTAYERHTIVMERIEVQKNDVLSARDAEIDKLVKDLNAKLTLIENIQNKQQLISEKVVAPLLAEDVRGIKIEKITYKNTSSGRVVSVSGFAASREDLHLFRQALEGNTAFKEVDLPASAFVQGSNIKFNLNLTPS